MSKHSVVTVDKLWGREEWLVNDETAGYCVKRMTLRPDYRCSLHYHDVKDETFYVVEGEIMLAVDGITHRLQPGEYMRLRPGMIHRFWASGNTPVVFIEASTYHSDDDVVRLEDSCYCG